MNTCAQAPACPEKHSLLAGTTTPAAPRTQPVRRAQIRTRLCNGTLGRPTVAIGCSPTQLQAALTSARNGPNSLTEIGRENTLMAWQLTRLGRSIRHPFDHVAALQEAINTSAGGWRFHFS